MIPYRSIYEKITIPLEIDDEIKIGKFKNKSAIVKGFGKDDKGQPTVKTTKGEIPLFKFRIAKLMKNSYSLIEQILENLDYYADYYGTSGAREISHRFKNNDPQAIKTMASKMSKFITSKNNLIPIPSRDGTSNNTLELAYAISDITGCGVHDIIKGKPRESVYFVKKKGGNPNLIDFGYKLTDEIPINPVLIDGVYDTGTTLRTALKLIPNARIVVFAKTIKKEI